MYGLGSHFPIKLEMIWEMEAFEMFTFCQTGHVRTLYASIYFFLPEYDVQRNDL